MRLYVTIYKTYYNLNICNIYIIRVCWNTKISQNRISAFYLCGPLIFSILLYFFQWRLHITNLMLQPTSRSCDKCCLKTPIWRMVRNQCHQDTEQRVQWVIRWQAEGYAFRSLWKDLTEWQMINRDEWYVVFSGQVPKTHATHPSQMNLINLGIPWSTTWFQGTVEYTRA